MGEEGFEEWDADFLDQLIQVEELALSSTQPPPPPPQLPQPPPFQPPQPQTQPPLRLAPSNENIYISYSPPRELSQRPVDYSKKRFDQPFNEVLASAPISVRRSGNSSDVKIDKLKKELGRVSKQLSDLEQECLELRRERDKKEEQLKSVFSQIEVKDAEVHCLKTTHWECGVLQEHPGIHPQYQNVNTSNEQAGSRLDIATSTFKGIGVQTDKIGDPSHLTVNHDVSTSHDLSNKLLAIWSSLHGQRSGKNLVSKLFMACPIDFQVLFGCLNMNVHSRISTKSLKNKIPPDMVSQDKCQSIHSSEAAKVSHLYTVLTKISNGMVQLEVLFEALLDLCTLQNVIIVYRSLRILHVVLNHLLSLENNSERRDNVIVEGLCSGNNILDFHGSGSNKRSYSGHTSFGMRLFDLEILCKKDFSSYVTPMSVSSINWVALFELMHQIAMRNSEEHVKYEAGSIMNVIFMNSNAYLEREKFDQTLVFKSVSQLIRKEAGLRVQKQAVQLLYLLLNCPKLLVTFCSGCKEETEIAVAADNDAELPEFLGYSTILQGLADCVSSCGNGSQDLKLRRNAIIVLAFLASSGNAGFEILLSHKPSKRTNFLVLILGLLVSETNLEAPEYTAEPPEIFKERTLLMREALIFLNRIVSNPAYSGTVLRVLTNSRDVASLTVDIANRLSRKGQGFLQSDSMTKQMRESEIADLARVFRKRVFIYLGDNSSMNAPCPGSTDILN